MRNCLSAAKAFKARRPPRSSTASLPSFFIILSLVLVRASEQVVGLIQQPARPAAHHFVLQGLRAAGLILDGQRLLEQAFKLGAVARRLGMPFGLGEQSPGALATGLHNSPVEIGLRLLLAAARPG